MKQRFMRPAAPLACALALLLPLLSGCGATSTATLRGAGTGGATGAAVAISHGPQLGYFWSTSNANLYPILGVPAAAHFGPALLTAKYTAGVIGGTPAKSWALVLDATGTLTRLTLPSLNASVVTTGVPQDAIFVLSPSATIAAVASPSLGTVLVLSGVDATPTISDLAVPSGTVLAGVAVSDGGTLLCGWSKPGVAGVQIGTLAAAGASVIATVTSWGGAAFAPASVTAASDRAAIADGTTAQVFLLNAVGSSSPNTASLAAGGLLQSPVAVAIGSDGKFIFVADSAKPRLARIDLTGATAPGTIACACQPTRLIPVSGSSVFQLAADIPGQPAWMLDTRTTTQRAFFVPALAPAPNTQSAQ